MDFKTITAVLASVPDGLAVIGAWKCMEALAAGDPEGCVRLSPDQPMDARALAGFFRCDPAVVETALDIFGRLQLLTVEDGLIRVPGCGKAGLSEEELAEKREYERARKARWRAKRKQQQMCNAACNAVCNAVCNAPVTNTNGDNSCDTGDAFCPNGDAGDMACEGGDKDARSRAVDGFSLPGDATCDTGHEVYNINNINNKDNTYANKLISIYKTQKETGNGTGNGISSTPEGSHGMILPENLPMPCRNVLDTWNKLPLKKFTGLVPSLLRKMSVLLDRYGEETVCQTVESIRFSSFLLGKTSGFHVTLGWLLDPDHFAKVLSGKYLDRDDGAYGYTGRDDGGSYCMGRDDGANGWMKRQPGERFPFYLPGEGDEPMDEEEREQAIYEFFHPTNPKLEKAKKLLGLK